MLLWQPTVRIPATLSEPETLVLFGAVLLGISSWSRRHVLHASENSEPVVRSESAPAVAASEPVALAARTLACDAAKVA